MSYLYKRTSQDGETVNYFSGAGELAATLSQEQGLWIRNTYRTQISVISPAAPFTSLADAQHSIEATFEVIDRGQHVKA